MCHDSKTLVFGLEHFIDKIGYQAVAYRELKIPVKYMVVDNSGLSREFAEKYKANVCVVKNKMWGKVFYSIKLLLRYRPEVVEVYDTGRMTLIYILLSKVFFKKVVLILRGGELKGLVLKRNSVRDRGLKLGLLMADKIIAKEHNIAADLSSLGFRDENISFVGNAVPTKEGGNSSFEGRHIDILYLNSVRKSRHVDVIVKAVAILRDRGVTVNVVITGFNTFNKTPYQMEPEAEEEVKCLVESLNLEDNIKLLGFVSNSDEYYKDAKIFVFPAEVVFANYSLLESMSRGVVPVVAGGEGATSIVTDYIQGRVLGWDPSEWANAIEEILLDRTLWEKYSTNSIEKIKKEFSLKVWGENMLSARP